MTELNVCQAGHTFHESKVVNTSNGPMHVWDWEMYRNQFNTYCTGQDDVSMSLDLYGTWEKPDYARAKQILAGTPGTVLDFGAHIGWFTVLAARLNHYVIAVEADPENMRLLELNWPTEKPQGRRVLSWVKGLPRMEATDKEPVRFLKADVEGAEGQVIDVTRPLWENRLIEHALLEISPVFADYYPALVDELIGYGYDAFIVKAEMDWHINGGDVVFEQENVWFKRL